ncbi:MAG: hypothetical protein LBJ08_12410 [Bifidobacteriaceae bacterium]|jgi:hypothetical protein|nr:hypothetical protein [Bifidobacteriaceae bacterium]
MPRAEGKGRQSKYSQILVHVFDQHYRPGTKVVAFARTEFVAAAAALGIDLPKNLGDVLYSFRYRRPLPAEIASRAPEGMVWIIVGVGDAVYEFRAVADQPLTPNRHLRAIKIPDSTPGIIAQHALGSEQALLAKVRYNRLIDLFTGIVCHSLQNHLRTKVPGLGQIETDEVYLGVDKSGTQYVIPVEAKGGTDRLSVVQMNQDLALAAHRFPALECRLVGAQFADEDIYLFLFAEAAQGGSVEVLAEGRYRLVPPDSISALELRSYRIPAPPFAATHG